VSAPLTLRPAAPADLPAVLELNQANLPAVGPTTAARLDWFLANAELVMLAVTDEDDVAGFVIVLTEGSSYDSPNYRWFAERLDRFVYVDRIAVDAAQRGSGAGRRLYDHVVAHARRGDWRRVVAEVNVEPRNDVSLAFHEHYGFQIVAEVADPRYEGHRVAMVQLDL
jgi:hypothetical protein